MAVMVQLFAYVTSVLQLFDACRKQHMEKCFHCIEIGQLREI